MRSGPERAPARPTATDPALGAALARSAARHAHLCPRQVLGARIALLGARQLGLPVPRRDKRLLAIVETDGCFADGVWAATGCRVGGRTLRVEDHGKVAATLVDVRGGAAWRIRPADGARDAAQAWAAAHGIGTARRRPGEARRDEGDRVLARWTAYLEAYQHLPDAVLLVAAPVALARPIGEIVGHEAARAVCAGCGEEVGNGREVAGADGALRCVACAGGAYWRPA